MSLSTEGQMRASGVSAFADLGSFNKSASRTARDDQEGFRLLTVFNNRRLSYAITFVRGYLSYFDPNFLFLDKSIDKYRAPDVGLLYIFELPLLLVGSYQLIRKWNRGSATLFWWVLVAPIAAAFTLPPPNPVRSLVFLPSFQIISAVGVLAIRDAFLQIRKKKKILYFLGVVLCVGVVLVSIGYYLLQYFVHSPVEDASYWYVGRKEMVQQLSAVEDQYDRIIVSKYLDFPYIFFLYYRRVDPADYLKRGGTISGGFAEEGNTYGKYEFRSISQSERSGVQRVLFVGLPTEVFDHQAFVVDKIFYPDGSPAIVFFK
jgi:hypothetical protein